MKGLILKDIINLKRSSKIFGIILLVTGMMAISSKDADYFGTIFLITTPVLIMSTFTFDEAAKWDCYALTLPVSRDNIIQGKYILMLLFNLIGCILNCTLVIFINAMTKNEQLYEGIKVSVLGTAIFILFFCIIIPVIVKFGVEKTRILFVLIYIIPFLIGSFVIDIIKERYPKPPKALIEAVNYMKNHANVLLPALIMVALYISYSISVGIYRKKEF